MTIAHSIFDTLTKCYPEVDRIALGTLSVLANLPEGTIALLNEDYGKRLKKACGLAEPNGSPLSPATMRDHLTEAMPRVNQRDTVLLEMLNGWQLHPEIFTTATNLRQVIDMTPLASVVEIIRQRLKPLLETPIPATKPKTIVPKSTVHCPRAVPPRVIQPPPVDSIDAKLDEVATRFHLSAEAKMPLRAILLEARRKGVEHEFPFQSNSAFEELMKKLPRDTFIALDSNPPRYVLDAPFAFSILPREKVGTRVIFEKEEEEEVWEEEALTEEIVDTEPVEGIEKVDFTAIRAELQRNWHPLNDPRFNGAPLFRLPPAIERSMGPYVFKVLADGANLKATMNRCDRGLLQEALDSVENAIHLLQDPRLRVLLVAATLPDTPNQARFRLFTVDKSTRFAPFEFGEEEEV